jgi:ATP-binding cassette, subfamily C, bacterial CydC
MKSMIASLTIVWRLWQQIRPQLGWMALATLLGLMTIGSGIGLMTLSAYLISEAALHPPLAALAVAIVGVRIFGIIRGIFRYLERLVSHAAIFRQLAQLRIWLYRSLVPLAPARLLALMNESGRGYTSGDLLSRLVADIDTLQEFYVRVISPPLVAIIIGLIMWFVLGAFNVLFALTLFAFYILAGVGVPLLTHLLSRKLGQRLVATRSALQMALIDSIQGVADLLAFGQGRRASRYARRSN